MGGRKRKPEGREGPAAAAGMVRVAAPAPGAVAARAAGGGGKKAKAADKKAKKRLQKELRAAQAEAARAQRARVRDAYAFDAAAALAPFAAFKPKGAAAGEEAFALAFGLGFAELPAEVAAALPGLLEANMAGPYGDEWAQAKAQKAREMADEEARYTVVRAPGGALAAFCQYRFLVEEEVDVLYIYELQVAEGFRRRGLGRLLLMCMELLAKRAAMQGVMLTVQKANPGGVRFYEKMKYTTAPIDPSFIVGPLEAGTYTYTILNKMFGTQGLALLQKQAEVARTAHGAKAKEIAKMEQRHNVTYASTM